MLPPFQGMARCLAVDKLSRLVDQSFDVRARSLVCCRIGLSAGPQDIPLFDFRNGRGCPGDLYSLANNSAKYSASEWRDIGYGTPCGFCFILTNDSECLRPAVDPINLSAKQFCQGESQAMGLSRMPIARTRRVTILP
jgi:hypothetical protein